MAQRRMIDKKISVSEQVANLSVKGQLLYTWLIPHADDIGLLPYSSRTIKALVVPMWEDTSEEIGILLEDMVFQNLLSVVQYGNEKYFLINKFQQHQTLKKDRQPQTLIKLDGKAKPKENWKTLDSIMETFGKHSVPEEKGSEEKRNEDNITTNVVSNEVAEVVAVDNPQISEKTSNKTNELISLFEPVNPNYERIFANKTQRKAIELMMKRFGYEKLRKVIESLPEVINKPYAPTITTPVQLESKMGQLISFLKKEQITSTSGKVAIQT